MLERLFGSRAKSIPVELAYTRLDEYLTLVATSPEDQQMVVGHGLNLADSMFVKQFTTAQTFRSISADQQGAYLAKLNKVVEDLKHVDLGISLGYRLFWFYLVVLLRNDTERVDNYSARLEELGEKGVPLGASV